MVKILFINPVIREEDNPKHIPYGIALLAAIAINDGHQVQVYDANAWRKGDEVLEQVCAADDWDIIAIGGLTTAFGYIKKACKIVRRINPQTFILAGGGFLTSMPREIMDWMPEIDLGVVGEAFVTFPVVLRMFDEHKLIKIPLDFQKTLGIIYRKSNGTPVLNGVRPNIPNLDALPWPAWELFPLDIYFANSKLLFSEESFTSKRRLDVNGSLGCNLICRYCWHLGTTGDMVIEENEDGINDVRFTYGRNIRYHSPDYIVNMVQYLRDTYDIDFISFIDENMMTMDAYSKRTWIFDLCEAWIAAGLQPTCRSKGIPHDDSCKGVHWGGTSHATLHRKESLEHMFKAGCSQLVYGLESFDRDILKTLGKGSTREKNINSVAICQSAGINPIPNIIIGFPEETFESIRNTITALLELGIHAKPHFATAYPGSEWYYDYKDSIIEQYKGNLEAYIADLGDATKITATISHRFSAMELLGLQKIVELRDLRLLELTQIHWNEADQFMKPLATPKTSFNMVKKKIQAPLAKVVG
ncbi:MAG: B12-binding domain-containing radical SAM protein [Gammaproteobacteria bacterium]|nr:B12-binding domain-containing radical SAM protein [Gammaproteobacteria bacterium]